MCCVSLGLVLGSTTVARAYDFPAASVIPSSISTFGDGPLYMALRKYTGFALGSDLKNAQSKELHICAAKMRYGKKPDSKILQLYCSNRKQNSARLVKFWVNFTSPVYKNVAWKINLSLPGNRHNNAPFIAELESRFGKPMVSFLPLSYSWVVGSTHLTLKEDQYGVQLELWDRSLHNIT